MPDPIADDFASINAKLREIEAARHPINTSPTPGTGTGWGVWYASGKCWCIMRPNGIYTPRDLPGEKPTLYTTAAEAEAAVRAQGNYAVVKDLVTIKEYKE